MSAPTPAPGDENPREGYYPDPSIPGYVRYWNGASWVPGTSRPAPQQGEPTPASPHRPPPPPSPPPLPSAAVDETGPMFFDEVDGPDAMSSDGETGGRQEPSTVWQADTSRQTGFGGDRDRRVSWGDTDRTADRAGRTADRTAGTTDRADGTDPRTPGGTPAGSTPAGSEPGRSAPADRAPQDPRRAAPAQDPTAGALPGMRDGSGGVPDATTALRADRPGRGAGKAPAEGTMTIRAVTPEATSPKSSAPTPPQAHAQEPSALSTPLTPGPGGGSASWAQQVHRLAQPDRTAQPQQQQPQQQPPQQQRRPSPQPQPSPQQQPRYEQRRPVPAQQQAGRPDQPVVPWKPPVDDPFQQLARAQAAARPAGLGKRLVARLLDTVVLGALVGAAGFPLVTRAMDHIDEKIEAAKQSGETVTVWLVDSTTAGLFGAVLGAFLVLGFVLEALPTAKWGRTLGKKLCGLEVRDIESHGPPAIGAALRRWLVYGVLGILVIGVVNVLWCLVDRPWRQCWHDKAAHTFVAG